jgi:hypothetical protein
MLAEPHINVSVGGLIKNLGWKNENLLPEAIGSGFSQAIQTLLALVREPKW